MNKKDFEFKTANEEFFFDKYMESEQRYKDQVETSQELYKQLDKLRIEKDLIEFEYKLKLESLPNFD